ncbi:MAG: MFS transporter [Cytophagales bacterium]|nr:MFS transporter [Cytophaga sp.]
MYSSSNPSINYTKVFLVLSTLFFMWGLITVLNISLLDEIRDIFQLDYNEALYINVALYGTYFFIGIPAGALINWLGFRKGIIVGTALSGIGCFLFYPAAEDRSYIMLLIALFVLGTGFTILQVAANPYVALLGMRGKGASKLTFVQGFNSFGTFLATLLASGILMTIVGLKPDSFLTMTPDELIQHKIIMVQIPYLIMGIIWILLSLSVLFSELPKINIKDQIPLIRENESEPRKYMFQYPQVVNGAISLFLYVGAEVSLAYYIDWKAEQLIPYYWGCALLGRFMGAGLLYVATSPRKLMTISGGLAALLLLIYLLTNSADQYIGTSNANMDPALYCLVLAGLCNSIIWPAVFTMGIDGMGKYTLNASSFLVMGVSGGAIIPIIFLYLFTDVSLWAAFPLLIAAYIMVVWFGLRGSRYEKKNNFY